MYKGKKISVAMATFNGEKYIAEQLQCIINQTVPPDEIVICDDGSADNTVAIIEGYKAIARKSGIKIVVIANEKNLGFVRNFEKAILSTTGDCVFLADQDDIWELSKIGEVVSVFIEYPETELVIHDYDHVDASGCFLSKGEAFLHCVLDDLGNNIFHCNSRVTDLSAVRGAGMSICITREFALHVLPFGGGYLYYHDEWLAFCAVCDGKALVLRRTLAHHRIHGQNVTGGHTDRVSLFRRVGRLRRRLNESNIVSIVGTRDFGREMVAYMEAVGVDNADAYNAAMHVVRVGDAVVDAFSSGCVSGVRKLVNLYRRDIRYRRTGWGNFAVQLLLVVRFGKRRRLEVLADYL